MSEQVKTSGAELPHWQLESIYRGLGSDEFRADKRAFRETLAGIERYFDEQGIGGVGPAAGAGEGAGRGAGPATGDTVTDVSEPGTQVQTLTRALTLQERLVELMGTLGAYLSLRIATDSFDAAAQAELSELRATSARSGAIAARFKAWLEHVDLAAAARESEEVESHRHFLERFKEEAEHLLGYEAEALAAELDASGGSAWAKLYSDLTSRERISAVVDDVPEEDAAEAAVPGEYGIAELRTLQAHASEDVRRRAYQAELELLGRNELSFAAAMNGIKGQVGTLARRRGWDGPLAASLFQHGISEKSLVAMHEAAEERFEALRDYLRSKAALISKPTLAWYDLFAPLPQAQAPRFTWEEAKAIVIERFASYSDRLAGFAQRTFNEGWIDVPPRRGKRSGAFCSAVHTRGESRVMLNFGGNLSDVFTLAHELGHAYHNDCKVRYGRGVLQVPTPMTMAETASIFCETLLFEGLVGDGTPAQRLAVLEQNLQQSTQLLLDIHSRFLFESAVFEKRRERELSAEELSAIMEDAQARTFGDAIDEGARNRLMWAHKPHYYSSGRSFYNFPYTFGWLFGLGLYARYREEGDAFRERYDELLASTGMADAADLAKRFGIDIEDTAFWRSSLDVIQGRVTAFQELTTGRVE